MARLLVFFAVSLLACYVKAEDDCVCLEYTEEEKKEIWDFLSKITKDMTGDEGILPGLLSPIVPCGNCLDRKKRTVLPPVKEDIPEIDSEEIFMPQADARCPVGYGRIAFRCINLSDLYKKK